MRQIGDAKHLWVHVSMKKIRLESEHFLKLLRSARQEEKAFSTVEKLLIVAVSLTLAHRPRPGSKLHLNFADLAHGIFVTFPDYAGADKELYLRGKLRQTVPKPNEGLVRTQMFGSKAPLKRWFEWVPRERGFYVNEEGMRHAETLLGLKRHGATQPGTISLSAAILDPTFNELLTMQKAIEPDLRLIEAIGRLSFMLRPARPLDTDQPELIRTITRGSKVAGCPKTQLKSAFDRLASFYKTEADNLNTDSAHASSEAKISELQRLYQQCMSILSRKASNPLIDHAYYRPGGSRSAASLALH